MRLREMNPSTVAVSSVLGLDAGANYPERGIPGDRETYTTAIATLTTYQDCPLRKGITSLTLSAGTYSYISVTSTRKYKRHAGGTLRTCIGAHPRDDRVLFHERHNAKALKVSLARKMKSHGATLAGLVNGSKPHLISRRADNRASA
jgi:hypothetical protein